MRAFAVGGTAALLSVGLFLALWGSPPDAYQGEYVRIMYVHVPAAVSAYGAAAVAFGAGALYLWRRDRRWDFVGRAGAELAALFSGLTLLTGMLWGKPVWGVWWAWDARLVTTAVLFLLYVGCLLVRDLADDPERGRRLSAAVAVLAFLDVPVVHYSVVWFRTLHQGPSISLQGVKLAPEFLLPLAVNAVAYLALLSVLLAERARLASLEGER
ncbi:MAG: cytochrome c biogenesis protein CcsA [Armatimonadota bacterium]|nr:cytochrome c biogenesis protein CcsA [Armatimonadota bacterium]MDR5675055.1 cytochrome c biogenesis protein CcsA [Armatimonadota bacterium]MDR5688496.1 cytochrome c biogenesis protein CcsA [Armatimonadota bacterium]MDR7387559.1 cytochrome c biogenesis protein CcsA [Armatimonadota bacterium]MDR7389594.1 cytochrome c biogenesis protein CcsA [Armatimonadota bacterium]